MSAKVFVDTNVLVYCRDASEPKKQAQNSAWMAALWKQRTGRLSFQVLQEYYVTVTSKLSPWWRIV
jgi:predicted nucleic acid-binding protein